MKEGQYCIGQYRVDFGVLISPESIADLERASEANGIVLAEDCTTYDLMRGYHSSYCRCTVRRHPDSIFADTRLAPPWLRLSRCPPSCLPPSRGRPVPALSRHLQLEGPADPPNLPATR